MHEVAPEELPGGATLRPAKPSDVPQILERVQDLAAYEGVPEAVETHVGMLQQSLFGESREAYAHVVDLDGVIVGVAVFFRTYSTWTGRPGIWIDDLYVTPQHRGSGYGKALLVSLARVCALNGYRRLEWTVLDWNEPSVAFYRSLGAAPQDEWTTHRLDQAGIDSLAGEGPLP